MTKLSDPYKEISSAYDLIMGRREEIPFILKLVKAEHPRARTILELGCGTGKLLKPFEERYTVAGVDISAPMLEIARKRVERGKFYLQNLASFEIGEKFDVILCLFNSLNHLRRFSEWRSAFRRCKEHLNEGGALIFDINTPASLRAYSEEGARVERISSHLVVTEFTALRPASLEMRINVYSPAGRKLYSLSESKILERAYPSAMIRAELKRHFSQIRAIDPLRERVDRYSEVLYFICKN